MPRRDGPVNLAVKKMKSSSVIDGPARSDLSVAQQSMVGGTTLGFGTIVRTATAGKETETIEGAELIRKGIGDPCANQQMAPALMPDSTMSGSHASWSSSGSPHSRHTASMLLVLPPRRR